MYLFGNDFTTFALYLCTHALTIPRICVNCNILGCFVLTHNPWCVSQFSLLPHCAIFIMNALSFICRFRQYAELAPVKPPTRQWNKLFERTIVCIVENFTFKLFVCCMLWTHLHLHIFFFFFLLFFEIHCLTIYLHYVRDALVWITIYTVCTTLLDLYGLSSFSLLPWYFYKCVAVTIQQRILLLFYNTQFCIFRGYRILLVQTE